MTAPAVTARAALAAEFLGTLLLLAIVVGSGIMGERLAAGNVAVALLANAAATAAGLYVLIELLGPVSGAHFNPAVTLALRMQGNRFPAPWGCYLIAQACGALLGVWLAHAMFGLPLWQPGTHVRSGGAQALSEAVATFGLLLAECYTVWVQATPEEHMSRVLAQGDTRPMAGHAGNREAMNDLRRILESRAAFYAKADEVFETSGRTVDDSFAALRAQLEPATRLAA